ncbi:MAG: sphinganine kinase lcb4 [Cirrosporium novae-zelandiae]|nr:MAG: sphinganine kinase lcb4 [Cirrosporium novae-zelandiae]
MASETASTNDPFRDPSADPSLEDIHHTPSVAESTLAVGRNASLTLGTKELIVLDEGFVDQGNGLCCGLIPERNKTTKTIPFFNILWAELSNFDIIIHYAKPIAKDKVRVAYITYNVEKTERSKVTEWTAKLLNRAYGKSQRQKRVKVLVNPFGGKGQAQKTFIRDVEPILAAARCLIDVERTKFQGHAVEIAENLDYNAFDVIASASGDGLPHEVFNGLGRKPDAIKALQKVAVVQLPCGSGNAMCGNLNGTSSPTMAALCLVKGLRTPLDLVSITQGGRRTLSFLSQSVGIIAESDLATEHLRWMGAARFTYGFLIRLIRKQLYPCDLAVKVEVEDKATIRKHYHRELTSHSDENARRGDFINTETVGLPPLKYGTETDELPGDWEVVSYDTMGNFYAGNMAYMSTGANFFPASLPDDGCMDLVNIDGDVSRTAALQCMFAVDKLHGEFFDLPQVKYRKVTAYRITPKRQRDGYISIDGEKIPFEPFQAEVHRGLGTVLSRTGRVYEAPGVTYNYVG